MLYVVTQMSTCRHGVDGLKFCCACMWQPETQSVNIVSSAQFFEQEACERTIHEVQKGESSPIAQSGDPYNLLT